MKRIGLIHWSVPRSTTGAEARERAERLRELGYAVDLAAGKGDGPGLLAALRDRPPVAVVIDLSRLPMQGRDVALALRQRKTTRHVPLVFAGGEPEKVARVRAMLPDAVFTTWGRIGSALERAIERPPAAPVVPHSVLAGYSGTPLAKKLGIAGAVALIGAPKGFEEILAPLPRGAVVRRGARGACDLAIWFPRSRQELESEVGRFGKLPAMGLWIAWRKQAARPNGSGGSDGLTQNLVREVGLAAGLVDYKVCAIDATWSGLKFARRAAKASARGGARKR